MYRTSDGTLVAADTHRLEAFVYEGRVLGERHPVAADKNPAASDEEVDRVVLAVGLIEEVHTIGTPLRKNDRID
jgi:hypothetical protein